MTNCSHEKHGVHKPTTCVVTETLWGTRYLSLQKASHPTFQLCSICIHSFFISQEEQPIICHFFSLRKHSYTTATSTPQTTTNCLMCHKRKQSSCKIRATFSLLQDFWSSHSPVKPLTRTLIRHSKKSGPKAKPQTLTPQYRHWEQMGPPHD